MKIELYKTKEGKIYDVTQMVEGLEWAGDINAVARTMDITVANAPYDRNLKDLPSIALGDPVAVTMDKEIFYGRCYGREKTSEHGAVTWNCIDLLQHLLKSTARYSFRGTTAEAITAQVCADIQFPVGTLAVTGIVIPAMLCDKDMAIYDIIMSAYTKAYKQNGKLYQCLMDDRELSVVEKGLVLAGGFTLSEDMNITKSAFSESTEAIVDKVKIYDEKGQQVGEISDTGLQDIYGTFQATYDVEKGVDPATGARALMTGPEQSLTIEAIGDINCIAGRGVTLKDTATGMSGLYWIKSDKHTFKDGIHTMELELDFKNLMDEKEAAEQTEGGGTVGSV